MSKPIRIQRRRTRGWKMPPETKAVTRPGKWGNHFTVINGNRGNAMRLYEHWLMNSEPGKRIAEAARAELRGFNLACYCPLPKDGGPDFCHAAVLLKVANEEVSK